MRLIRTLGHWIRRSPYMLVFVGFFLVEIALANLKVAWEVITPGYDMEAGIVRVPTTTRTPLEVTVLANLITMTPGTLTLEVDLETYDLYVHGLYVHDVEEFRASIARIERFMLKAMR
jgi:multicomponent Na+:H+ antiporter subunit E